MRFKNLNVTEILAEMKEMRWMRWMSPCICLTLASLFVGLCPQVASAQASRIKGYAVQVAALSSKQSADELVKGLSAQGINAYWINGASYGAVGTSPIHRVRIGNFPTIASAHTYAEKLLGSGLLEAYAIAAYEPPAKGSYISNGKVHSFAQKYQGRQFNADAIDMVAAIGTRGWLLLSSRSIDLTLRQGRQGTQAPTPLSRELAKLATYVGSRGWSMNNNIAKLLAPQTPANVASVASTKSWTVPYSRGPATVAVNTATPSAAAVNIPTPSAAAVNNPAPSAVEVNTPAPSQAAFNTPTPAAVAVNTSAPPAVTSTVSFNASAREIGRGSLTPATAIGARTSGSKLYTTPPRLQGSIEMRDGRMFMTLRNNDTDRPFTGMARVSLSDEKNSNQQDVMPMTITVGPDQEASFPVDEAKFKDGNWMLMVFDQNGAARLIRGASFPAPPKPDQVAAAPNSQKTPNSPSPQTPVIDEQTPQGPPSYVTGVYDATWAQAPAPPQGQQGQDVASQNAPAPATAPDPANTQNGAASTSPPPGPGEVTVNPRQIAITPENVTLELEISGQGPLNYIIVTLRAGDYQDVRQALMSTPQGRVPFLVPYEHSRGGFIYEIKDEAQRVLASGSGDFRQLAKGN